MGMRHGIVTPARKAGQTPARVVNIRSKRKNPLNKRIRIDRLLRSATPKILIKRRLGGIGDVIMTTPLLTALKELIPRCEITYATDMTYSDGALAQVIQHNPYVDRLIPNEMVRDAEYDYAVDITATGLNRERSGTVPPNRIDMFAEEVGVSIDADPVPVYIVEANERTKAIEEIDRLTGGRQGKTILAIQTRVTPARKAGQTPARVVNIRSKRKNPLNKRIRIDRLLRSATPKILIKRRLGGIGDVIMTTPLLTALKELIPRCEITYATDMTYSDGALAQVIQHNPYVDRLIPNEMVRDAEYDYAVDITATGLNRERSGTVPPNRIDMFAEEVGVSIDADPVPVYIVEANERTKAIEEIDRLTGGRQGKTILAIQTRSNDARRTWPLDKVQKLAELLTEDENTHVLLFDWGSTVKRWVSTNPRIHLVMNRSLPDTAALVQQMDTVICPDSSMLHIAGALNKKIVTIFGPIPPQSRINHYQNATAVFLDLPCKNCWYTPRCTKSVGNKMECLTEISPEMVKTVVEKKLIEPLQTQKSIVYGKDLTNRGQDPIILVRRETSGLGDLLMTTPAISALKARYPDKEIHVACQKNTWPVLQNNPNIDQILDVSDNFNYKRYFMVIDISSPCARYESTRVAAGKAVQKSRVEIFAEAMGVRNLITSLKPTYNVTEEEAKWAKDFLKQTTNPGQLKIAVGVSSAELYRNWPEENYQALFNMLKDRFELIVLDHSRKHMYTGIVDACGFPLRKAIAVLSQCDGLITVDTSLLHFAAALEVPTVAIFGPIDYKPRCKGYNNITVIKSELPCIPCWRNSQIACQRKGMVKCYSECIEKISPKEIAKVVRAKFLTATER